jgi:hypothetical protein
MIYKFRAILDNEDDVFRDIAIEAKDNLEDLHNALVNAFGFDGTEVGAFYTCGDDWAWHEEDGIPMFDTGDIPGEIKTMSEYKIDDLVHEQNTKLVYVYDLFSMWTFFVELAAIEENKDEVTYPALLFSHGELPDEATTSGFRGAGLLDDESMYNEDFEDDLDQDDLDMYGDDQGYEDQGFEENWN